MTRKLLIPAVCVLMALPAAAAPQRLVFDPDASELTFTLDTTLHLVHGSLVMSGGELSFDLDAGTARGELVIDATATDTGNRKRDAKMHSKVLESEIFPRFVFRAERVTGAIDRHGSGEVLLTGTIEIHGDSHPFTLPASVRVVDDLVEAHCEFQIPYVEWGMKDPSLLLIRAAKVVDVTVEARGRLERQVPSLSVP